MKGKMNPSFNGLTFINNMCEHFYFPFSTLISSSSKNFFMHTTDLKILEIHHSTQFGKLKKVELSKIIIKRHK